jgi:hypothetical protein
MGGPFPSESAVHLHRNMHVEAIRAGIGAKLGRAQSEKDRDLVARGVCPQCDAYMNLESSPETILCKSCSTKFRRV